MAGREKLKEDRPAGRIMNSNWMHSIILRQT